MKHSGRRALALMAATLLVAGCALGPAYQRPVLDLPAAYPEDSVGGAGRAIVKAEWWKLYNDARLNELVATTLARNVDIKLAVAQVEEAEDRKSTRLNSSHHRLSRMPSSA